MKNLELLYGIHNKVNKKYLKGIMLNVGLDPEKRKAVKKYSIGMKQRLGIAQAIMENQEIIILDEPMNGLDHFFYFEVPNQGETKLLAVAGECRDESFIKKVEKFNEAYRLKEKGAVLNWFDITAPDGFFSLNDTVGDIMSNEDGNKVMQELFQSFGQAKAQGGGMNSGMMKMLNGFTVLRMINMMGITSQMTSKAGEAEKINEVSKEQLLAINDRLNQIRK